MFFKISIFKNFTNFTAKHLCWSLFLIKLQAHRPAILLKRDSKTGAFLRNYYNSYEHFFFKEHLQWLLLRFNSRFRERSPEQNQCDCQR